MRPEETLVRELMCRHQTVASAESCTGGYIAKRITDIPGSSEVFAGACVTYTCDAKERLVGVSHETLETFTAVSQETAVEMAEGVRRALGTDFGISTTGIAGPSGGTPRMPVGTVWIAVASEDKTLTKLLHLPADETREEIRFAASSEAMELLLTLFT